MRFAILSSGGDGVGLALRLAAEGNRATIFIQDPETEGRGKGLVEHDTSPEHGEVIVADCTGFGSICDRFREHGAKVVGGSALADRLESDRKFSQQVMESCGIETPKAKSFTDWDAAKQFIEASETKLVFKPEGKLSGVVPSYCPSSNEELLASLEHFKSLVGASSPEFSLEEFIEGTCVSTEGWFDGEHFIEPFNHTIERKHFLNGDLGPSGGCVGNLVWLCDHDDPICQATVVRLEGFLREHGYCGAIDVNAVVNEEGVYGLEFTPRFGYDAFPSFLYSLYSGDFGSLLWDIASGNGRDRLDVADRFAAGVRLSIPPWPSEKFNAEQGVPIRGILQAELITDLYPYDVELSEDVLVTSGGYGIIGVMCAAGDSPGEAFARAYQKVKRLEVPDLQYRTDLAEVCYRDYRALEMLVTGRSGGWYGVDFDHSLATGSGKKLGEPIPKMVNRVKGWLRNGREVRIVTARVSPAVDESHEQSVAIHEWVKEFIGQSLEVTDKKDHEMLRLYDDRAKELERDTGELE